MEPLDFKNRLRQELIDRCKRNPRYSLRAFAAQLDLDASTLSKLLNGKRLIGKKLTLQLGALIGLSAEELAAFLSPAPSTEDSAEEIAFQQLTLDKFAVVSDWYHFAILELMQLEKFRADHQWIASALGLRKVEVQAAVARLVRVGLLKIERGGTWIDSSGGFTTSIGPDMISTAHRRLQEQFLEKATQALSQFSIQDRDHSTVTMVADRSRLPAAREKIKRFRRSLAKFLSEGENRDDVLNLNIALFPLTQIHQRKNS